MGGNWTDVRIASHQAKSSQSRSTQESPPRRPRFSNGDTMRFSFDRGDPSSAGRLQNTAHGASLAAWPIPEHPRWGLPFARLAWERVRRDVPNRHIPWLLLKSHPPRQSGATVTGHHSNCRAAARHARPWGTSPSSNVRIHRELRRRRHGRWIGGGLPPRATSGMSNLVGNISDIGNVDNLGIAGNLGDVRELCGSGSKQFSPHRRLQRQRRPQPPAEAAAPTRTSVGIYQELETLGLAPQAAVPTISVLPTLGTGHRWFANIAHCLRLRLTVSSTTTSNGWEHSSRE